MGVLDRFGQVAHRRAFGQHHMDIDPQPFSMKPARVGNAVCAIEEITRGLSVQNCSSIRFQTVARADQQVLDILVLDPATADLDLDRRHAAGQARTRTANPDRRNAGPGDLLRPLDGIAHRIGGCRHVGNIAALDALRGAMTAAQHDHLAAFGDAGNHRGNTERSDVDRANDLGNAGLAGHQVPSASLVGLLAPQSGQRI
jgi:hypothetical protein